MIGTTKLLVGLLAVQLLSGPYGKLDSLNLQGAQLHPSLATHSLDDGRLRHVSRDVLQDNPQVSTDPDFIRAIARSGSQGNLGSDGISAALYALYDGEAPLGFYGFETTSDADADHMEQVLTRTWVHNVSIGRAQVHRAGNVLVVVWNDGVSTDTWKAVNARVTERLQLD